MDMNKGDTQLIIKECKRQRATASQTAYILATASWETGGAMKPIKETVMPYHKDKNPSDATVISRLDAWARKTGRTRNIYWRDGWFGRGYVQLTHRANYVNASNKLGVDLVARPADAMRPDIAVKVLVRGMLEGWFTGKRLGAYVDAAKTDFDGARRVVNGTDKAQEIAALAVQYQDAIGPYMVPKKKGLIQWLLDIFAQRR